MCDLGLCQVRLQQDARFPWLVLIPRREEATELDDLSSVDLCVLTGEIVAAGIAVRAFGDRSGRPVEKLNVGALGNVVPQLHVHVVGRRADDAAWPGPVWGAGDAVPYADGALDLAVTAARSSFQSKQT